GVIRDGRGEMHDIVWLSGEHTWLLEHFLDGGLHVHRRINLEMLPTDRRELAQGQTGNLVAGTCGGEYCLPGCPLDENFPWDAVEGGLRPR
ncbi:MAG TPA: hypothetical protein VF431_05530, partial [Candidatus Methylomirabilis sp.]